MSQTSRAALFFFLLFSITHAKAFEYPELNVVPLASERLEIESQKDRASRWRHLNFEVPATATFLSGAALLIEGNQGTDQKTWPKAGAWVGMGTGLLWWGVTRAYLDRNSFMNEGEQEISNLSKKTEREKLARERRAEEALNRAGKLAHRLKYLSVTTNLGASAFMFASAKDNSASRVLAIASGLLSFTPFVFGHPWEEAMKQQGKYKKRIFGPVAQVTALESAPGVLNPGILLSFQF